MSFIHICLNCLFVPSNHKLREDTDHICFIPHWLPRAFLALSRCSISVHMDSELCYVIYFPTLQRIHFRGEKTRARETEKLTSDLLGDHER